MLVAVVFHDNFLEFMLEYQILDLTKQTYRGIFHNEALLGFWATVIYLLRKKFGSAFF